MRLWGPHWECKAALHLGFEKGLADFSPRQKSLNSMGMIEKVFNEEIVESYF